MSSAESELYGIVKCSSEVLGFKSIVQDMDRHLGAILYSDASAALGVIQRQGLGKLRRVDCSCLFAQTLNADKVVQFAKVAGQENPGDIGTRASMPSWFAGMPRSRAASSEVDGLLFARGW